jgi:hypothetical protein
MWWGFFRLVIAATAQVCLLCLNSAYFHKLSAWNLLQVITIIQSHISVKTSSLENDESEKKLLIFLASNYLRKNLLKYYTIALNHPVYHARCYYVFIHLFRFL